MSTGHGAVRTTTNGQQDASPDEEHMKPLELLYLVSWYLSDCMTSEWSRRRLEISQEELGARAGLHRNCVGSIERGERDIGIRAIGRLAAALDISLAEFFAPFRRKRGRSL